jgi:hypothetical protein
MRLIGQKTAVSASERIGGFRIYVSPDHPGATRLRIERAGDQMIVRWKGEGFLQEAQTLAGPWTNARKAPPAAIDAKWPGLFFRTINNHGGLP